MTRQNLFSDLWDGENEEPGTRRRVFWRPDDARMGNDLNVFSDFHSFMAVRYQGPSALLTRP